MFLKKVENGSISYDLL
jgi:hypothetical protein